VSTDTARSIRYALLRAGESARLDKSDVKDAYNTFQRG
jgi:hypothetical protein